PEDRRIPGGTAREGEGIQPLPGRTVGLDGQRNRRRAHARSHRRGESTDPTEGESPLRVGPLLPGRQERAPLRRRTATLAAALRAGAGWRKTTADHEGRAASRARVEGNRSRRTDRGDGPGRKGLSSNERRRRAATRPLRGARGGPAFGLGIRRSLALPRPW